MEFREFTEYEDPLSQNYDIWSGLHAGGNNNPNSEENVALEEEPFEGDIEEQSDEDWFEEDLVTTLEEEPFIEIPEESEEESFEHTSGGSHRK